MAKGDLYIPEKVRADIQERLERRVQKTIAEFDSADEDEDVMTGHLGGNLTTHARKVVVYDAEIAGTWSWSLRYRKFRGRGPGATEKRLGADGIIELALDGPGGPQTKSMLFQSKMEDSTDVRGLVTQCAKLSTWREAAAVFNYGRSGFDGVKLDAALAARGDIRRADRIGLAEFLAQTFVGCEVGDTELRYYPDEKMLAWTDSDRRRVAARFTVKHRIRIDVKPPPSIQTDLAGVEEISPDEIARHRMQVTEQDLLGLDGSASLAEIKAAQKALTKIYHPDMWSGFPIEVRDLMETRTKEFQSVHASPRTRRR